MKVIVDLDQEFEDPDSPEEQIKKAEKGLLAHKQETIRLRRLYDKGLLRPTLTPELRARLRSEYFARGGKVTTCPPATAAGAVTSPYWDVDRGSVLHNVRDIYQDAKGERIIAALDETDDID